MSDTVMAIIAAVVKSVIVIGGLMTLFAYMTLIERRVIARLQNRLGPNRAGPLGFFQPLADGIKMAFKEQIIPLQAKLLVYLIAPCLSVFVAISAFAVVPLGDALDSLPSYWAPFIADINVGILYILAISSLAVYGIVLGGWASGNRYSLLGALRSAAQMVSYEVSIAIALAGTFMLAGTLSMVGIVKAQVAHDPANPYAGVWYILLQPLAFVLYGIAATAEVNRAPFDLPEAEQELVAGYLTEFSGLRWSLYQMAEYINMIVVSSVLATLFLGGWTLGGLAGIPGLPFVWFLAKVAIFLFIFIWIRATLPRIRYDQLMRFGWQVLLPLAVLNLLVTAAVVTENWSPWILTIWGFGALIVGTIVMLLRRKARVPAVPQGTLTLPVSVRLVSLDNPAEQSPAPVS